MLSRLLYNYLYAVQQNYCDATCIDSMSAMQYAVSMTDNDIENLIKNFAKLLDNERYHELRQYYDFKRSYTMYLDEIELDIRVQLIVGIKNTRIHEFKHSDYQLTYIRNWPIWNLSNSPERINGKIICNYSGDIQLFNSHYTFIALGVL